MKHFLAPTLAALALAACSESSPSPLAPASPEQLAAPVAPFYARGARRHRRRLHRRLQGRGARSARQGEREGRSSTARRRSSRTTWCSRASRPPSRRARSPCSRTIPTWRTSSRTASVEAWTTQSGATWGIDRIDQRSRPAERHVHLHLHRLGRDGVHHRHRHPDQPLRSSAAAPPWRTTPWAMDERPGLQRPRHARGRHGRRRPPTAWPRAWQLRAVRVLNCYGSGTNSGVIAGMNWVASQPCRARRSPTCRWAAATRRRRTRAANSLASSGVFLAVAAGNSNANACNYSPSSAANTTTVAASTSTDARASYSNYGELRGPLRAGLEHHLHLASTAARTPSAAPRWPRRT